MTEKQLGNRGDLRSPAAKKCLDREAPKIEDIDDILNFLARECGFKNWAEYEEDGSPCPQIKFVYAIEQAYELGKKDGLIEAKQFGEEMEKMIDANSHLTGEALMEAFGMIKEKCHQFVKKCDVSIGIVQSYTKSTKRLNDSVSVGERK